MADTTVPFTATYGIATGITGTSIIGETGVVSVAVTSFNGLTGAVTGVSSVEGLTGSVLLPGHDLYLYSIGII